MGILSGVGGSLHETLGDQQSIERVPVVLRQARDRERMRCSTASALILDPVPSHP